MNIDKKEKDWVYSDGFKRYKDGLNDLWDYNYKSEPFKLAEKEGRKHYLELYLKYIEKYKHNGVYISLWNGEKFIYIEIKQRFLQPIIEDYKLEIEKLDKEIKGL